MRCENFALYHNKRLLRADPCRRSVIKEFALAFSCAYIELWMHAKHEQILKFTEISIISLLNTNVLAFAVCLSENSVSNTSQVHRFIQGGGGA